MKKAKKEITDFREVYKQPFKRRYSKVLTSDYKMAFYFPFEMIYPDGYFLSPENQEKVIEILNGRKGKIDAELRYNPDDTTIYAGDKEFIIVRGWGYLTGIGGLNLPEEKAAKIQDEFAEWIVTTLNNPNQD